MNGVEGSVMDTQWSFSKLVWQELQGNTDLFLATIFIFLDTQ
jgi:hypothetical protein